ncbi:hypothetical protein FRC04_003508 [Tulasnella sp. 424]|nr:hypothetical protein FRC04_003508 [Tulasnella sp. 424]
MSTFNDTSSSDRSAGSAEALHGHDLAHHVTAKPLELQYSELVAIHFGSFALSRAPLMTRRKAKKFVKYLWSITAGLLPYEGPVQLPQISLQDINYAISYANSLIKRGKAAARLLAIADFDALTRDLP